jgi:hypothetical protein
MKRLINSTWLFCLLTATLLASSLAFGPCVEKQNIEDVFSNPLAHIKVTVTDVEGLSGGDGTAADPYDYSTGEVTFVYDAIAYGHRGEVLTDYNGVMQLKVTPGKLKDPNQKVTFTNGKALGQTVIVRKTHGRVALWIEDINCVDDYGREINCIITGSSPDITQRHRQGSHATGVSNIIHIKNPTLRQIQEDETISQNDTSALPDNFIEINCRINDPDGPLQDDHGQLLVTGIFNEGFFVTDLAGKTAAGRHNNYNHLYAYSYSYPEDLEVGDRLDRLEGTSQDFSGCTQISFPSWARALDEHRNPEPFRVADIDALAPPEVISSSMCSEGSTTKEYEVNLCGHSKKEWGLEKLESARVRLENIRTPDVFINCDFNGDLTATPEWVDGKDLEAICQMLCLKYDTYGDLVDPGDNIIAKEIVAKPEILQEIAVETCQTDSDCASNQCGSPLENDGICRTICPWEASITNIRPNCIEVNIPAEIVCSETTTLQQFGQYVVGMDDGEGPLINLMTRESLPEFDPLDPDNMGLTIDFVQGNLRQTRAARPRWMILVGNRPNDVPERLKP